MWQALHVELEPQGLTVVTVALDTDVEAARPSHEDASPTHPALVDPSLSLVDLFGITNVPMGVWIDETGTIVRPAEPAFTPAPEPSAATSAGASSQRPADAAVVPPAQQALYAAIIDSIGDRDRYVAAVRDWAANGAASNWVMSPDQVIAASRPRPWDHAVAAAEFELAQHLHRTGRPDAATPHFERAHELDPRNWSYVRQHLALEEGWVARIMSVIERVGPESFYPRLEM